MTTPINPKDAYYIARDLRLTLEAKCNDYMSNAGIDKFDNCIFGKLGDLYKAAKRSEYFADCVFGNDIAKKRDDALSHMSNPNLPW